MKKELSTKEILLNLQEEVGIYLKSREEESRYTLTVKDYTKHLAQFMEHYNYYRALSNLIDFHKVPNDENNEEFITLYNDFFFMYFNLVDEIHTIVEKFNRAAEDEGDLVTFKDLVQAIDVDDLDFALSYNIERKDEKALVSPVTLAYVYQATRKIDRAQE